jgi:hypothetical protein
MEMKEQPDSLKIQKKKTCNQNKFMKSKKNSWLPQNQKENIEIVSISGTGV